MNINNYEFTDKDLDVRDVGDSNGTLWVNTHGIPARMKKQDATAIAKHFNVDNESLVEGIKELIDQSSSSFINHPVVSVSDLQKLITKEDIEE
jgi:hypothetical protein